MLSEFLVKNSTALLCPWNWNRFRPLNLVRPSWQLPTRCMKGCQPGVLKAANQVYDISPAPSLVSYFPEKKIVCLPMPQPFNHPVSVTALNLCSNILDQALEGLKMMAKVATGQDPSTDNASVNVVPLDDGTFFAVSGLSFNIIAMVPA